VAAVVDPSRYDAAPKADRFTIAWIGQRATLAHLEPVRAMVLDAGFALRVIADAAPEGTEHVPWTLDGEARALAQCHVGIMPLPDDPFARGKCGYKLLQYYAAGLPAVASPVGTNRALAEGGALFAKTPAEFGAALARLRDDPALRAALGAKGRAFASRRYALEPLAERLVRILRTHVAL
jgi:glycosyltransferase involved in cell wall biosynthesis